MAPDNNNSAAAAKVPSKRKGAKGYSKAETKHFLDIMENILPIGPEEWDLVVEAHEEGEFGGNRDVDSLRRKYTTLHRKQIPTGDPNMPDAVRQAKRIKYKIGTKADLGDGEEEYNLTMNQFDGDNIDPNLQDDDEVDGANLLDSDGATAGPTSSQKSPSSSNSDSTIATLTPKVGTKRSYNSRNSQQQDFIELMKLQMLQESEARKAQMDLLSQSLKLLTLYSKHTKRPAKRRQLLIERPNNTHSE